MTKSKEKKSTAKTGQTRRRWKPGMPMQEATADDPIYNLGFVIQPMSSGSFSKSTKEKEPKDTDVEKLAGEKQEHQSNKQGG
jgi:hypothetical protein